MCKVAEEIKKRETRNFALNGLKVQLIKLGLESHHPLSDLQGYSSVISSTGSLKARRRINDSLEDFVLLSFSLCHRLEIRTKSQNISFVIILSAHLKMVQTFV